MTHPKVVIALWLVVLSASLAGAFALRVETTVDSVLDRTGDEWQFYQEAQEEFGGDEVVVVMVSSDQPYDTDLIRHVASLSEKLRAVPGVRRVDSLSTVPSIFEGEGGELVFEPAASLDEEGSFAVSVRSVLESDPDARGLLASSDGRAFALNVHLEQGAYGNSAEILHSVAELAGPGAVWSGVPVFRNHTNVRTEAELVAFVPLTAGLMFALLLGFFRSFLLALLPLVVSGVSVAVVVGVMGFGGLPMTISTLILPTVLLALGCAYSMHVLSAATQPGDDDAGFEARLAPVALPVALSGLTTAIGFVALSTVRIDALRQVGGLGGLGAIVSTLSVLTLLPALLVVSEYSRDDRVQSWLRGRGADAVSRSVASYRVLILLAAAAVCAVAAVGAARLRVESDVIQWFPESDPIRVAYSEVRDRLAGISPVNVVVEANDGTGVATPDVLVALGALVDHVEGLSTVSRATSIESPVSRVHQIVSSGSLGAADPSLIEQYLLLLGSAEHIDDLISHDRTKANVWVRSRSNSSGDLLAVASEAENWWGRHGPESTSARATGIMFEFARAQQAISVGQIAGLATALAAISVVLFLAFGSLGVALSALLPNVVPILLSFGLMGWLDVPLDAGTVLVGNLALGIAVDDTIHLVNALREGGSSIGGFRRALERVLPPLFMTTVVLSAGFAVLGFSSFVFIRNLGLLTALILVVCLLADLFLLPSALVRREGKER